MDELYWLLLPFAAVVGWLAASHRGGKSGRRTGSLLDPEGFVLPPLHLFDLGAFVCAPGLTVTG